MQLSAIQAFDFGLGQLLATIYSQDNIAGPKNWQQLVKRPPANKIFRGNIDDRGVNGVVRAVESMKAQVDGLVTSKGQLQSNSPSLPLIAYGRSSGMRVVDPEAAGYQFGKHAVVEKDDESQQVNISLAKVEIEYQLILMAWDQPTLDAMQLAWLFHVPHTEQSKHKFPLAYEIDGCLLEGVIAEIHDPKTVAFEDASLPMSDGRLYAARLPIRVQAYAIQGAKVSLLTEMRWQLELRVADKGCY